MKRPDEYVITKTQLPLKLAYALTIHKAQGMSLDCVELDLGTSIFENGQFYTALSRCRTLDNLSISKLKFTRIKCHEKVREFYEDIPGLLVSDAEHARKQRLKWLEKMNNENDEKRKS